MRHLRRLSVFAVALAAVGTLVGTSAGAPRSGKITLVAYSTPREAYAKLIPAFNQTPAGKDTGFEQSYGASGEQARAVKSGLKADIVAFSLQPDMQDLVNAKLVSPNWNKNSYKGMVSRSV